MCMLLMGCVCTDTGWVHASAPAGAPLLRSGLTATLPLILCGVQVVTAGMEAYTRLSNNKRELRQWRPSVPSVAAVLVTDSH